MKPGRAHNFGTYFVTAQTWERRALFRSEKLAELFLETLQLYRSERKYLLHEFVLMPDHFHALLTPDGITLERTMQFIKGGFSHRAGKEVAPRLEIWQRGFTDHRIRDAGDYCHHREYIRLNPVRARLCLDPREYPYSSAGSDTVLDPVPQRLKPLS
ncbi:MAG: transposase [Acidobacteria bacterium]|nr:transposase [Acidobacteriota bacterium]